MILIRVIKQPTEFAYVCVCVCVFRSRSRLSHKQGGMSRNGDGGGGRRPRRLFSPCLSLPTILLCLTPSLVVRGDEAYPGTADDRRQAVMQYASSLSADALSGDWTSVRQSILEACGLKVRVDVGACL